MPDDWPGAVLAIGFGTLILATRRRFAADILGLPRMPWNRRPLRAEPAVVRNMVLVTGLGFITIGASWLVGLPGFIPFLVLLPVIAAAALIPILRER